MSVPAYKRTEGNLIILNNCISLHNLVIRLCKNESIIGKKNSKLLGFPFLENSRKVMYCICNANELNTQKEYDSIRRIYFQYDALKYLNNLYIDIRTIIEYTHCDNEKFHQLLTLIETCKRTLKNWIKSDKRKDIKNDL